MKNYLIVPILLFILSSCNKEEKCIEQKKANPAMLSAEQKATNPYKVGQVYTFIGDSGHTYKVEVTHRSSKVLKGQIDQYNHNPKCEDIFFYEYETTSLSWDGKPWMSAEMPAFFNYVHFMAGGHLPAYVVPKRADSCLVSGKWLYPCQKIIMSSIDGQKPPSPCDIYYHKDYGFVKFHIGAGEHLELKL